MTEEAHDVADASLVAYVDGALPAADREAVAARVAGDPALTARLAALARGSRPFADAYGVLLEAAPKARLAAALARAEAARGAAASRRAQPAAVRRWLRPLAAAVVLFLAGGAAGIGVADLLPRTEVADDESHRPLSEWRATVAEYLTLYTRDTLANFPDDPALREAELKSVGDKLQLGLSLDKVKLDNLALKRSQLFELDGRPLAQIAYLAPDDGPVAFCIIADGEGDHPPGFEERQGKNIVYWSKNGHAFMLIGNLARGTLETLAASLAARVT